jgi:hypothetical protein
MEHGEALGLQRGACFVATPSRAAGLIPYRKTAIDRDLQENNRAWIVGLF